MLTSKLKKLFVNAAVKSFSKSLLLKWFILFHLYIISSKDVLLRRDFTSKLAMNNPESCSIIFLAYSKLLVVIGSKIGA